MKRRIIRVRWYTCHRKWGYRRPATCTATNAGEEVRVRTKQTAVAWAREDCHLLRKAGFLCQLVVHGKNGRIQYENTYGRDPRRYKG